jgi:hypothetical protein
MHVPAEQVSVCVQALLSVHPEPSGNCVLLHRPVAGLQVAGEWHWRIVLQEVVIPARHEPLPLQ